MKRYFLLILAALFLFTAGCAREEAPPATAEPPSEQEMQPSVPAPPPAAEETPETPTLSAEETYLQSLLAGMSLEEKVGQLFFVRAPGAKDAEEAAAYHLGGLLLFTRDYRDSAGQWLSKEDFTAKLAGIQAAAKEDSGIPLFIGSDEEGGTVTRATRNPNLFAAKLPSPQAIFRSGGMEAIATEAFELNSALLGYGINVNFAPVCDLSTDPDDFIYDRAFGQDAEATAEFVKTVCRAMDGCFVAGERRSMGAVLKHFPGYGDNVDTHTGIAVDERAYEQFVREDFLPFRAGIDAGADFVLVSHNIVNSMDESLPASLSAPVHRILREELGFEGLIITDDLAMDAVAAYAENGDVAVMALLAGNDMIVTTDYALQIPRVLGAVEQGKLSVERIDESVLRILRTKLSLGILQMGA